MADILEQGKWVLLTVVLFLASLAANEWFFAGSEFVRGINWIYLPAGVRLICTLLFGVPGMLGLLVASWIACFGYFFPDDFMRSLAGGLLATCAPCRSIARPAFPAFARPARRAYPRTDRPRLTGRPAAFSARHYG